MYIRIENVKDGEGFWNSLALKGLKDKEEFIYKKFRFKHLIFPSPHEEELEIQSYEFCAFENLKYFVYCFNLKEIELFLKYNFKIYQIKPKTKLQKNKIGTMQVLFEKEEVIYYDITEKVLNLYKNLEKRKRNRFFKKLNDLYYEYYKRNFGTLFRHSCSSDRNKGIPIYRTL